MVADNKKEPATDSSEKVSSAVISGDSKVSSGFLDKITRNKLRISLILIAIVLLISLLHFGLHVGEKVYAQAAGHKVYRSDINNLIGNTKGVTDHQAATTLANKYLGEAMAKQAGIKVTDKDVEAQYGSTISKLKATNKYVYQSDKNSVYFNSLLAYNSGLYKGQLLVANFSRHIAYQSPFLDIQKATDPLLGNTAAIAADKQYAHDFITGLYDQIKSGKITFNQAIQKEHDDPVVGIKSYQALAHSGSFDTSNVNLGSTALIAPQSIRPIVSKMKAGELSSPFVVSVSNSLTHKDITAESYYLVVRMDSTKGGHSGLTYEQYLIQSKKHFRYKVYV